MKRGKFSPTCIEKINNNTSLQIVHRLFNSLRPHHGQFWMPSLCSGLHILEPTLVRPQVLLVWRSAKMLGVHALCAVSEITDTERETRHRVFRLWRTPMQSEAMVCGQVSQIKR